jgi:peroxiredoxin (alkyl hydroperoxide reductase subunit C)
MTETLTEAKVGLQVPNFALTCYDPVKNDFTKVALADLQAAGKWTILFFYPADFTFV